MAVAVPFIHFLYIIYCFFKLHGIQNTYNSTILELKPNFFSAKYLETTSFFVHFKNPLNIFPGTNDTSYICFLISFFPTFTSMQHFQQILFLNFNSIIISFSFDSHSSPLCQLSDSVFITLYFHSDHGRATDSDTFLIQDSQAERITSLP